MLNLEVLQDVVGDDPVLMKDMLVQFVETTQVDMHNLQDALAAGNARDVAGLAHRIKGSCYVVGAADLADLANSLEQDGRQDKTAGFADLSTRIATEFQNVIQEIEKI